MHGLDLFTGYGGLTLALAPWVRPIAYCENDRYCTAQLLSRMADGQLPSVPIWDDVATLPGWELPGVDIIYGGFPCQNISVAGNGEGLAGKQSGLFFEILRLAQEVRPQFLFLENVPAIRTRGLAAVVRELARIGYDSRWCTLSAAQVGAPHRRERWFLLANTIPPGRRQEHPGGRPMGGEDHGLSQRKEASGGSGISSQELAHSDSPGLSGQAHAGSEEDPQGRGQDHWRSMSAPFERGWWSVEPDVGRVANGVALRVDRIKQLGNGVIPLQARTAFKYLAGIK